MLNHNFRFIVNGGSPGLKISKIENKVSMRMVQNCDIELKNVFVPEDDSLVPILFRISLMYLISFPTPTLHMLKTAW